MDGVDAPSTPSWLFKLYCYMLYYALQLFDILVLLILVALVSMLERRHMASVQHRDGPTNVALLGVGQPLLDALKLVVQTVCSTETWLSILMALISIICLVFSVFAIVWSVFSYVALCDCGCNSCILYFICIVLIGDINDINLGHSCQSRFSIMATCRCSLM